MRYYYEPPEDYKITYGKFHSCNHPLYNRCTLFEFEGKGVAVIQQRFDPATKSTYWSNIDPWLIDELYLSPYFRKFFKEYAEYGTNGLYPTITIRQLMYKLKMKPLPKARWETVFDHYHI